MSLDACAEIVARSDPDRFASVMIAPRAARARLLPIYAFNVEVVRAPWVTTEPLLAQMRHQFWRDVLAEIAAGEVPRAHEVADELGFLTPGACDLLDALVVARGWDIERAAFADDAGFDAYIDATAGNLAWVAAQTLGAPDTAETVVRDAAWAAGLAAYLVAVPELEARGRRPLVDGRPGAVSALAKRGLARLAAARANRGRVPARARPALYPVLDAGTLLRRAARDPGLVGQGGLATGPARLALRRVWVAATGLW
ncbi:MAG: squalene/phytoene synthase family protein [Pseudomonadota bacterium]